MALNDLIHLVCFFSMYSLVFLDPLHSSYSLQLPSTYVGGHYCTLYKYFFCQNYLFSDIVHFLTNISSCELWVKEYINNIQIRLRILNPCHRTGQRIKLKNQFC